MPKKKAEVVEVKTTEEEPHKTNTTMIVVICVMVGLIVLATIDSFTTKYFSRMCSALAKWTMEHAPGSFVVYELIIMIFLVCCLPYGPLGVLSGALFVQKYGNKGIYMAGIALFLTTMCGACICFVLARNNFKQAVQKQIDNTPKVCFIFMFLISKYFYTWSIPSLLTTKIPNLTDIYRSCALCLSYNSIPAQVFEELGSIDSKWSGYRNGNSHSFGSSPKRPNQLFPRNHLTHMERFYHR